jgi:hypothetical protein
MPFYQCQLKKMISCLDIILRSFDCRFTECQFFKQSINQRPSFKSTKSGDRSEYYYYVGQGNNNPLVKSIFKKRGWWVETDSIHKAHLVWTQLKIKKLLYKIEKHDSNMVYGCPLAEKPRR